MDIPVYENFIDFENMVSSRTESIEAAPEGDCFFIVMPDSSMAPRFNQGDLILCKKTQKASPGSTVIFTLAGNTYLRNMSYEKDFLHFIPENPDFETISIIGVSLRSAKIKAIVL